MKELYYVTYSDEESYANYVEKGYGYEFHTAYITAESKEEAIAIAREQYGTYDCVINEYWVKSESELAEAERKEKIEKEKAEIRKKQIEQRKAERKAFEAAHPEIVAERVRKAKITRANTEIKKALKEIEALKAKIAYYEKVIEKES